MEPPRDTKMNGHDLSAKPHGKAALQDPRLNKGTAYSFEERKKLGVDGLMPCVVETLELQVKRCLKQFRSFEIPLQKYTYLLDLKDRNETLFYSLLLGNLEEMLPIVYTPTVGEACVKYSDIWRQSRGMYFSSRDVGNIRNLLNNWEAENVDIIVVTDGSRILGLGDLGANGMGIPVGKLSLYVAGAGFHPSRTLPVTIDAGTNNEEFLNDPLYLGAHHKRLDDKAYYSLIEEFMTAAKDKWPNVLIQFEDFSNDHCFELLEKYRHKQLCFNDDIQGTGAVISAGFMNAIKMIPVPLNQQTYVFYGAGSAGVGVADMMVQVLVEHGLSPEAARKKFYLVDTKGLVTKNRGDVLQAHKVPYARDDITEQLTSLEAVVKAIKPSGLIGLAGAGRAFTESILKEMAKNNERPLIMALSNPTSKSECTAQEAFEWTDGKAIFASGSPFPPVNYKGKVYEAGQGNNMYIFPGLGFGAFLAKATQVTDGMIIAAAKALADFVTKEELDVGKIYPSLDKIRDISTSIAVAVIERAMSEGLSKLSPKPANLTQYVREHIYQPEYANITAKL